MSASAEWSAGSEAGRSAERCGAKRAGCRVVVVRRASAGLATAKLGVLRLPFAAPWQVCVRPGIPDFLRVYPT